MSLPRISESGRVCRRASRASPDAGGPEVGGVMQDRLSVG
jgi:hypothetical protein